MTEEGAGYVYPVRGGGSRSGGLLGEEHIKSTLHRRGPGLGGRKPVRGTGTANLCVKTRPSTQESGRRYFPVRPVLAHFEDEGRGGAGWIKGWEAETDHTRNQSSGRKKR